MAAKKQRARKRPTAKKAALAKNESVRSWKIEPVKRAMAQIEDQEALVRLSQKGIDLITRTPRLIAAVAKVQGKENETREKQMLDRAHEDAKLARAEIDRDFSNLRAMAVIAMWSTLENLTKDLVVAWIRHERKVFEREVFQKLTVSLTEYARVSAMQRAHFIADLVEQKLAGPQRIGWGRFNSLLEAIGLRATLSPDHAKKLLELQQVRNVIAHRGGLVDRRLKSACPWIKARVGNPLQITQKDLNGYYLVTREVVLQIIYSVGDSEGMNLREEVEG